MPHPLSRTKSIKVAQCLDPCFDELFYHSLLQAGETRDLLPASHEKKIDIRSVWSHDRFCYLCIVNVAFSTPSAAEDFAATRLLQCNMHCSTSRFDQKSALTH